MVKKLNWLDYEKCLAVVLVLFYFCSLEPISLLSDLGISKFFTLGRYISYLMMACLAFYNLADRKLENPFKMFRNVLLFLKDHLTLVMFGLCMVFCSIMASVVEPLLIVLLLVSCWKCDFSKLLKTIVLTQLVFFVMVIALSFMGVLENLSFNRDGEYRAALGFIYPLELQSLFFFMCLEWFYIRKKNYGLISIVVILVVNILFYIQTRARFSTLLLIIACICFFLLKYVPVLWHKFRGNKEKGKEDGKSEEKTGIWKKVFSPVGIGTFFVGSWISLVTLFYYTISQQFLFSVPMRKVFRFLDRVFNNRIVLARGAYVDYGYQAFGKKINWIGLGGVRSEYEADKVGKKYNYVDVSYFKNMFDYGYVFMFFILLFYGITWFQSFKKKDYVLSVILAMILMGAVFEPRLVQISMNPFLILFAPLIMIDNSWIISQLSKIRLYG